mgnify:CR=1 FL=1
MRLATLTLLLLPVMAPHVAAKAPAKADLADVAERTLAGNCDPGAPGMAVLLARGDEVLYRGACGQANLELGVPLSPDHVFRIGSVTKQFAAAAVLKLAEDGKLDMNDRVIDHLPWFRMSDPYVTHDMRIRDLLSHRSGLSLGSGDLLYWPTTD